jgi:uncharacterized membrane protein YhaH (DUF805 family)
MIQVEQDIRKNRFAPPSATVADMDAMNSTFAEIVVFSPRGRIGRLRLLAYLFTALLISMIAVVALMTFFEIESDFQLGLFVLFECIPLGVLTAFWSIQRCHDINWSGWIVLLHLVPMINFVLGLILVLKSGTNGPNRFGLPPPPNTIVIHILVGFCIISVLLFVFQILEIMPELVTP